MWPSVTCPQSSSCGGLLSRCRADDISLSNNSLDIFFPLIGRIDTCSDVSAQHRKTELVPICGFTKYPAKLEKTLRCKRMHVTLISPSALFSNKLKWCAKPHVILCYNCLYWSGNVLRTNTYNLHIWILVQQYSGTSYIHTYTTCCCGIF